MLAARDSGYRTITSSVYLYDSEESGGQNVFAFMPVYRRQSPGETETQRRENLVGFYVGVFRLDTLMEGRRLASHLGIDVQVFDYTLPVGSSWTYIRPAANPSGRTPFKPLKDPRLLEGDVPGFGAPVNVSGCQWFIVCTPTEAYRERLEHSLPLVSVVASLLVTCILLLYLNDILTRAEKVERLVVKRTAELRAANVQLSLEMQERERAAQGLRDSEALYSSLVESLPVHVLRKDRNGQFTFANRSFCRLLGKSIDEIVGKSDFDFYPREMAEKYRADDGSVLETRELFETEEQNQQDGKTRYVHVMKSPVFDAAGKIIGTQAIFWDVTRSERSEAPSSMQELVSRARNLAKRPFWPTEPRDPHAMTHPGMTECCWPPALVAQREYLSVVRESGNLGR